jgi:hypothetical protein
MKKILTKVDHMTYTFGNYRITSETGYWWVSPIKPTYGKGTWLEGTIRCDTQGDAFRIANIFTGEDLVNQSMREMFALLADERKEANA